MKVGVEKSLIFWLKLWFFSTISGVLKILRKGVGQFHENEVFY